MPDVVKPYENQLIGAFLVALGYRGGEIGFDRPIRANLLQQTPLDQRFGDLITGAERLVVIEFKRSDGHAGLKEESGKWNLAAFASWAEKHVELVQRASSYHFLAVPSTRGEDLVAARSYPDFLMAAAKGISVARQPEILADELIEELYRPKQLGGDPNEVLNDYLKPIASFRKAKVRRSSAGSSIASNDFSILGVAHHPGKGLRFLMDDSLSMVLKLERQHELVRKSPERERDRGLER